MRRFLDVLLILFLVAAGALSVAPAADFSDEEFAYWAFQPLGKVQPPDVHDRSRVSNPIDAFVFARLEAAGLDQRPRASKRSLIRRAYFDLLGLPPTKAEVEEYSSDDAPDAYERLIAKLIASPRYGERWGRHWLDIVRYADSDGFRADDYRPHAWKYRDYVIDSLNKDISYPQFVGEQIAGSEAYPESSEAIIASGYLRHWPFEHNQRDLHRHRDEILNDITDVTADVFLGLSFQCARCHDHKFDPILRKDYYRLRAFFEAIVPYDHLKASPRSVVKRREEEMGPWLKATSDVRKRIEVIEAPIRNRLEQPAIDKFVPKFQKLLQKPTESLSPLEKQIQYLASLQLKRESRNLAAKIKGDDKKLWEELQRELASFDHMKPAALPPVQSVSDVGPVAPPTHVPGNESLAIEPGFLSILDPRPATIPAVPGRNSTGRRSALASWIADPDNPLSHRVLVNRVWQHHFGRGLVASANDFGRQGKPPSHPDLLDWLTREFLRGGSRLKRLHYLIMTSRTYQQSSARNEDDPRFTHCETVDPGNRLLWRMPIRRLDAEILRDSFLFVSGELESKAGGPGAGESSRRRSIYCKVMRNNRGELMDAFDSPSHFGSCARRDVTTTPPQALLLLNGSWVRGRATAMAKLVLRGVDDDRLRDGADDRLRDGGVGQLAAGVLERALGRSPTPTERKSIEEFLSRQTRLIRAEEDAKDPVLSALTDLCLMLVNTNEFLYVD